jgi:hypothetical protein
MTPWIVLGVVALLVLVLLGLYLSMTAGRLDRLHRRIDLSRVALDAHLLRRSGVALEVASVGVLDPASSVLVAEAAHDARTAADRPDPERALAESDLTAALVAAIDEEEVATMGAEAAVLVGELGAACRRVQLARRFHNDGVRACRQLRRQRLVRLFRLAGRTPWPDTWEMDDTIPAGLTAGDGP